MLTKQNGTYEDIFEIRYEMPWQAETEITEISSASSMLIKNLSKSLVNDALQGENDEESDFCHSRGLERMFWGNG